jgi:hypothetical protein
VAPRDSLLVAVLLAFLGLCPETAWAEPKHATFEKVIENSATIVVARFLGDQPDEKKATIQVEVSQVLKGDLNPGKHLFAFQDRPHFGAKGDEFVAFLDKDRIWRFMASPQKGENKVGQGILQITGFYDYNAYWITPGLVTLDQLKTYLKDGSLVYRFRGDVYFPEPGKLGWKAGSLVLSGTYDAIKNKVNVKGLPNLNGFPAQPEVYIHSRHEESNLDLSYERSGYRPLTLIGKVRGFDNKTGEMKARFAVSTPEVLTQKTFEDYLADERKGPYYYKFKLTCTPTKDGTIPKVVFLTMGKWTENQSTHLNGFGKAPLHPFGTYYNGPTLRSGSVGIGGPASIVPKTMIDESAKDDWVMRMLVKTEAGEYLTFGFQIGELKRDENRFSWFPKNELPYSLYHSPVNGTVTLHEDGSDGCNLHDHARFGRVQSK